MKLTNKFAMWSTILVLIVAATGCVTIWHLVTLRRIAISTAAEYEALDRSNGLVTQVGWLRDVLRGPAAPTYRTTQSLDDIRPEIVKVVEALQVASRADEGDGTAEIELSRKASEQLRGADALLSPIPPPESGKTPEAQAAAAARELQQLHQSLQAVSKLMPEAARRHVLQAADRLTFRILWTCVFLLVMLVLSSAVHVHQYRFLVRPLLWLRDDMRVSAANQYRENVRRRGDREFTEVAQYFNGVVKELGALYHDLEQKVIARSRELVRSERLASVGYLAAGVAHEINNPLSVISGYTELAAMRLRRIMLGPEDESEPAETSQAEAEAEQLAAALEAQVVIRDEAFRCKEITSRLLSLSRGGGEGREPLHLDDVARQIAVLTKGLKNYRDRKVLLDLEEAGPLEVVANPTEMKQVLLNLTVNALDAVPPQTGQVTLSSRQSADWVEVSITDNGKGMTQQTLEQIFEPFFTAKRGSGEPGTGLGLSITHAIVESHGGRIAAESAGPGHGSRFTVRFPKRKGLASSNGARTRPAALPAGSHS